MSDILEELFPDPSSVHKEDCEFFFGSGEQSELLSACLKLITTNPNPQISLSKNTLTPPKSEKEGLSKSNPYLLWLIKIFIIILIIVAMIFF